MIRNRQYDLIRVLTMLSAVLLPLTLVTGYYGMNIPLPFQHHWWANLIVLGLMATIGRASPGTSAASAGSSAEGTQPLHIMWAPWRMSYVGADPAERNPGCVFCELPAQATTPPHISSTAAAWPT